MDQIEQLVQRVQHVQHGFGDIRRAADEVIAAHDRDASFAFATTLLASPVHQARMLATLLLGHLAPTSADSLGLLRRAVSRDDDWRVQEMLARAFDMYCATIGYEVALLQIEAWLADPHPHVRRAITEGLRMWTSRPYFRDHPDHAVHLLGALHADESEYVRTSVGNALRDISRKHPEIVNQEVSQWDRTDKRVVHTYKLASKFLPS